MAALHEFENRTGFSFCVTENRFRLHAIRGDQGELREFATSLRASVPAGISAVLADLLITRLDPLKDAAELPERLAMSLKLDSKASHNLRRLGDLLSLVVRPRFENRLPDETLAFALAQCHLLTNVDRYILLRTVLVMLTVHCTVREAVFLQRALRRLNTIGDDPILSHCLQLARASEDALLPIDPLEIGAIDEYTRGDYRRAFDTSRTILTGAPERLILGELAGKCVARDVTLEPSIGMLPSLARDVARRAQRSLCVSREERMADRSFGKLADLYANTGLGLQLDALRPHLLRSDNSGKAERLGFVATGIATPRSCGSLPGGRATLHWLGGAPTHSPAAIQFAALEADSMAIYESDEAHVVPDSRRLKFSGQAALAARDFERASVAFYSWRACATLLAEKEEAYLYWFRSLVGAGHFFDALRVLADAFVFEGFQISIEQPEDLLRQAANAQELDVASAVGAYLVLRSAPSLRKQIPMHRLVEAALRMQRVERPSDMQTPGDVTLRRIHAFFLKEMCRPENIDSVPRLAATTRDLILERLRICRTAAELDQSFSEELEGELAILERQLQVDQALQQQDRGRLAVSVVGLMSELGAAYERELRTFLSFGRAPTEVMFVLRAAPDGTLEVLKDVQSIATARFASAFLQLRDGFLRSNDYGLDTSLSVEIRHGSFVNQVRQAFEVNRLLTSKSGSLYQENEFFEGLIEGESKETQVAVDAYLQEFSTAIDAKLAEVPEKWLQIVTDQHEAVGPSEALFDFSYSPAELEELKERLPESAGTVAAVTEILLAELWERTDRSCKLVVKRLQADLRESLRARLDDLEQFFRSVLAADQAVLVSAKVADCRTEVDTSVDAVCTWFEPASTQPYAPFAIGTLLDAVIASVRRKNPLVTLEPNIDIQEGAPLPGRLFRPLFLAIGILLDNIVQKAPDQARGCALSARLGEGVLTIHATNALPISTNVTEMDAALTARMAAIASGEAASTLRREGGSGLTKIAKLLRVDLDQKTPRIRHWIEGRNLTVEVVIDVT